MRYILLIFFSAFFSSVLAGSSSYDSIGIEETDGKKFILHKVEMSETLYSVSRRYNVPINQIIESNPPTEFGLEVGQVIRIPYEVKTKPERKEEKQVVGEVEQQQEKQDIIHRVALKETLYAISRKYDVTIEDIKAWNGLETNAIDVGQELIIKQSSTPLKKEPKNNEKENVSSIYKTHIVKQSETMYSLSKQYGVTIEDILKWNGMKSTDIGIGQELIVGETQKKPAAKDTTTVASPPVRADSTTSVPVKTKVDSSTFKHEEKDRMESPINASKEFEEIVESGTAALIEGSEGNRKYLALHRSAKVGTILRVRNEMNDQEVFVRVLGKLPDTSVNKNVVIRISKSAYDRLGAIDPKFRVTVSYIP